MSTEQNPGNSAEATADRVLITVLPEHIGQDRLEEVRDFGLRPYFYAHSRPSQYDIQRQDSEPAAGQEQRQQGEQL
jgi:hypothetical protein